MKNNIVVLGRNAPQDHDVGQVYRLDVMAAVVVAKGGYQHHDVGQFVASTPSER